MFDALLPVHVTHSLRRNIWGALQYYCVMVHTSHASISLSVVIELCHVALPCSSTHGRYRCIHYFLKSCALMVCPTPSHEKELGANKLKMAMMNLACMHSANEPITIAISNTYSSTLSHLYHLTKVEFDVVAEL